jgi:hypothetical protein
MKPVKQSFLFGKYEGSVFQSGDTTTAESLFEAIFNYKSNSLWNYIYKCEIVKSKCEDMIGCVAGQCVTINKKHICKFCFLWTVFIYFKKCVT